MMDFLPIRFKKFIAATAIAAALINPVFAGATPKAMSETMQRTAFVRESGPVADHQAIVLLPAYLGLINPSTIGLIVSIQQASVSMTTGNTTGTATINSVTVANTALFYGGQSPGAGTDFTNEYGSVDLTNATTLTATRNTSATNTVTLYVTVVEWKSSAVNSIQSGTASTSSGTSGTATITSVTTGNSIVLYNGQVCQVTGSSAQSTTIVHIQLTNATTVTVTRGASSGSAVIGHFMVLEFKSGILQSSTQNGTIAIAAASTSNTATITSVTTANTLLLYNGQISSNGSDAGNSWAYLVLTNATTVTATRVGTSGTQTPAFSVLEFKSANVKSNNSAQTVIATSTQTNTATITAIVTTKAIMSFLGDVNSAGSTIAVDTWANAVITNTTTITVGRGAGSGANTDTVSWNVLELVG